MVSRSERSIALEPQSGSGCIPTQSVGTMKKHVARMQRSGIRDWRDSELPGLRYAPFGLRCLGPP